MDIDSGNYEGDDLAFAQWWECEAEMWMGLVKWLRIYIIQYTLSSSQNAHGLTSLILAKT